MTNLNNMREYLASVVAQSEVDAKRREAQEAKNQQARAALDAMGTAGDDECCGECDDCEHASTDEGLAAAIADIDTDDHESCLAQMTYVTMVMAKRAGLELTAREAFEVWLTV